MGKTAFIFPGQGAQVCGMGQDFYENSETAKAVFDRATELLGFPFRSYVLRKMIVWTSRSIRRRQW